MPYLKISTILLLLFPIYSFSQDIYNISNDSVLNIYNKQIHNTYDFINGKEYKPYHTYKQDNPYLNSSQGTGTIYCSGSKYIIKVMRYDIFLDEVIVSISNSAISNSTININKTCIDSFAIKFDDKQYLLKNLKSHEKISKGFYEIPYSGKFQLLIKHVVKKRESEGEITYNHVIIPFLKINQEYYQINSRKRFFALFSKHKKELKKKLKTLNTDFVSPNYFNLIELIKYAESL